LSMGGVIMLQGSQVTHVIVIDHGLGGVDIWEVLYGKLLVPGSSLLQDCIVSPPIILVLFLVLPAYLLLCVG